MIKSENVFEDSIISKTEGIHDGDPTKSSVEGLGDLNPNPKRSEKNNKGYRTSQINRKKIEKAINN